MPRGNDSTAALVDLRGEYGQYGGNAEDMIAASRAAVGPELRAANKMSPDYEATAKLIEEGGLETADGMVDDATVLDLSVRGDFVVVVAETDSGRTFKQAFPATDFGVGNKHRVERAQRLLEREEPVVSEEREAARSRMEAAVEAANAAREAEEKAEAAREKARASRSSKKDDDKDDDKK